MNKLKKKLKLSIKRKRVSQSKKRGQDHLQMNIKFHKKQDELKAKIEILICKKFNHDLPNFLVRVSKYYHSLEFYKLYDRISN